MMMVCAILANCVCEDIPEGKRNVGIIAIAHIAANLLAEENKGVTLNA